MEECFSLHFLRATTHADLILRAVEEGVKYQVIHNASILTAVGCCGLQVGGANCGCGYLCTCNVLAQLYTFGETVSIPFWTETWKPESFADKIEQNLSRGLHTLCLLGKKLV